MKYIVFCDFDGTITVKDTCVELTKRYARDGWQRIEELWIQGKDDARRLSQMLLDMIDIDEAELDRFARSIAIDPHFREFTEIMEGEGIKTYIVSDGYDAIIEPILETNGLSHMTYYANSIRFEQGRMKAYFPRSNPSCMSCGNCKTDIIDGLREEEAVSIYIGDGYSDRCASQNGDIVFAKGDLIKILEGQGREFIRFEDFSDVIGYMKNNIL